MTIGYVVALVRSAVFQVLIISSPMLLVGMGVGLIISIFQATTSIQEQTLTFVPKIIAIFLTLVFFGPIIFGSMRAFTLDVIRRIPEMVL
jgi:flagellar biosynthetic protein FliQ